VRQRGKDSTFRMPANNAPTTYGHYHTNSNLETAKTMVGVIVARIGIDKTRYRLLN